ncbi:MAG: hypothetical protein J6T41_03265, partial [Neisseriaceae bacterium]|nr:hypothetical protein [Neisseriaceae bacterium]
VAGTAEGVLMVESEASELSEEIMLDAVTFGHDSFRPVIEAIIVSRKNKKNKKYFPQFSLIGILFFIILGLVKTTAIFFLNYGNTPLKTTNAFVLDYGGGYRSPDEYTLRFANNQRISNKEFEISAIIEAQAQDCLSVQYRENAVVIEVLPLANLGKMNEKECLTQ